MRREDAAKAEAVATPLTWDEANGILSEDRTRPPLLVPLTLLGCRVEGVELSSGGAFTGSTYSIGEALAASGGPPLRTLVLNEAVFAPSAMEAGGQLSFEQMKLPQLKEELAARGSKRTGLKAALQRKLHGLLVQAAIAAREEEEGATGPPKRARTDGGGGS